jgi:molecular chaperone GrpE
MKKKAEEQKTVEQGTESEILAAPGDTRPEEAPPEISVEEFEEMKKSYEELHDRFLRLSADFDNYKKRSARETEQQRKFANEKFACELLDVIDNLERAAGADEANLREGLNQIRKLFQAILEKQSISPIDSFGTNFDPRLHEAVAYIASDKNEGVILDEISRGYLMHDKVIRCAKVVVSRGNEE